MAAKAARWHSEAFLPAGFGAVAHTEPTGDGGAAFPASGVWQKVTKRVPAELKNDLRILIVFS